MRVVNRSAIVVKPKQPLVRWIQQVDPSATVTLREIIDDHSCYLAPEVLSRREQKEYLEQNHAAIFEQELRAWNQDRSTWPTPMTFTLFLEFFEITFHSLVYDMAGYALWENP